MSPEHDGPSMGHILSEVTKDAKEEWDQLTGEQAHALSDHLVVYIEVIDPAVPPDREADQLVSTKAMEEKYWESYERTQDLVNAILIDHAEHIAAALVISDLRTRLGLRGR